MASVGTWRAPLPFKVGGGGHKTVTRAYDRINAGLGTGLAQASGSAMDAVTRAEARAIALIYRATDRRFNQADPTRISTLLDRWEKILGIVPSGDDTELVRRNRVAARLSRKNSSAEAGVLALAETAFYPWEVVVHSVDIETNPSGVRLYWSAASPVSAGELTATRFFTSNVALICIEYKRPAAATDEEVDQRKAACSEALNEFMASWADFNFSETPLTGATADMHGFYLDRPNLDVACFYE